MSAAGPALSSLSRLRERAGVRAQLSVACHPVRMPDEILESDASFDHASDRGWTQIDTDISSHLPFSAAVEANGFVFVSGQASVDTDGTIVSGSFEDEMRRALQNVVDILNADTHEIEQPALARMEEVYL